MARRQIIFAEAALLPAGWAEGVAITLGDGGDITAVGADTAFDPGSMTRAAGPVIPGMPNLHSHAHQRAMAGMSEYRASGPGAEDSFWTWREVMHAFAGAVTPEVLETVAAQLYVEMVKAGFTSVCEFHYMHHQSGGVPYDDPAEMSYALIRAAKRAGIGLTLLPVLYSRGGYGDKEPNDGQRRFMSTSEQLLEIVSRIRDAVDGDPQMAVGLAPHSPRQVTTDAMRGAVSGLQEMSPSAPIHIHVAEQENDVTESVEHTGLRPVEWVFEHFDVDQRWCLVHATHITPKERLQMAESGSIAGICPTTEANLGDGLFPLIEYLGEAGRFGIGSDSHISVSMVEELRWLEYGQRLTRRRRNLAASGPGGSTGMRLYRDALAGGAQATGRTVGGLAAGNRADFIVLDTENPNLSGRRGERLIDSMVFAGNAPIVRDVWIGGNQVVSDGNHVVEAETRTAYAALLRDLEG